MKVYWSEGAAARLDEIYQYIAKASPQVAQELVNRLTARTQQIAELPYSGKQVPKYRREDVREMHERPFRILYKVSPDRIDVLTVLHYRQLTPDDLLK